MARTADDLTRYHGKLMIIDRRELYLLAFNLTSADIGRSRSFGGEFVRRYKNFGYFEIARPHVAGCGL